MSHISPVGVVTIAAGGELIECKALLSRPQVGGGKRGTISGFSPASRRRLLKLLARLDKRNQIPPLFLTLTYPDRFPVAEKKWARDLDALEKAIARKYPNSWAIWRKEMKERKSGESIGELAPHFHLVLFGVGFVESSWLAETWFRIVGSGDEKHLAAGTQVVRCYSWRALAAYVSKYLAKVERESIELGGMLTGRMWGIWNRAAMLVSAVVFQVGAEQWRLLSRTIRRFLKRRGVRMRSGRWRGVSAFLGFESASKLVEFVGYIECLFGESELSKSQ